jgi:hypothetical protein
MGNSKYVDLSQHWPIPLADTKVVILPIRNNQEALQLVKEILGGS